MKEIKNVILAECEERIESNGKRHIYRFNRTKDRLCVVEGYRAIDVETKEEYEIVKRNSRGQIISDLIDGKEYGLDVQKVSFKDKVEGYVKMKKKK